MSRRLLGTAAISGILLAAVTVPFLGSAHAAGCPSWTDPGGDAIPFALPLPAGNEPGLDILAASLGTVGTDVVATVKVATLSSSFSSVGDRFAVSFAVGTTNLRLAVTRDAANGTKPAVQNTTNSTAPAGVATANFSTATNTVTITAKLAEVDKAAGKPTAGLAATVTSATAEGQADAQASIAYDTARPATGTTYTIGASCGGDPGPSGTPTPTPTPSGSPPPTLPVGYPNAGCNTINDPANDAKATVSGQQPNGADRDLDIVGVAINTTATDLKAYLRITKLAMPNNAGGHDFELKFSANGKNVTLHAGELDTAQGAAQSQFGAPTYGELGTSKNTDLTPTATFDKTNNFVIISVPLAKVATATGGSFVAGRGLTAVSALSQWIYTPQQDKAPADTAQADAEADRVYTVGESPCFGPLPGKLTNTGKTTVQYTDAAAVAAKLTDSKDAPLAGKTLTFAIGSKSVTAVTQQDGVAKASLNPGVVAGTAYTLVTSFAGDNDAAKVSISTPFTVTTEVTKLVLTVSKNGAKRTVTAKLVDDDNAPVAGQVVTWYVNDKKVSSPKTNAAGVVTLTTAKPTQTVKASFAGVAGKYRAISASKKV
jgi:hypothetical protein